MLTLPGYTTTERLHESNRSVVYRARRAADGQRVILKILGDDFPSPARLAHLTREYEAACAARGEGVIEAYALERYRSTALIIFEDFGGESLDRLASAGPLAPGEICRIAARLAAILDRLHALGVTHNDLSPGNVVVNRATGELKLIDFGSAACPADGESGEGDPCADLRSLGAMIQHLSGGHHHTPPQLELQEKLASLGMLTSSVAHEIKNPLNFVTNFAELSIELTGELDGQVAELEGAGRLRPEEARSLSEIAGDLRQNVQKIRDHGRRADQIVRAMLEHTRSRIGGAREVDLSSLAREYTAAALQVARGATSIQVVWDLDPSLRAVRLVPEEIGRVVLNLVSNAAHAVEAKRKTAGEDYAPEIRITTRDAGDQVEIRIRDNGTGIPAAIRDKVWNPFFTTKPTGVGTGLGLSLSHDIVVQGHGGTMTVESEEGQVTEFCVRLPKRPRTQPPPPSGDTPA